MKELNTKTTIIKKEPELVISGNNDNNVKKRVFILHETLGIGKIDGWNPKNNDGPRRRCVTTSGIQFQMVSE